MLTMTEKLINIAMDSDIFVWINSDIDGAACAVLLNHIFPKFTYRHITFSSFEETYLKWAKKESLNYDKVFIIGLSISQQLLSKIDDPRLVIINNFGENLKAWDSIYISEETTSNIRLLFNKFKDKVSFTTPIKRLVLYVDDYKGFGDKFHESEVLNGLYRSFSYDRFGSFYRRFIDGYDGVTESELARSNQYYSGVNNTASTLSLFRGTIENYNVLGTHTDYPVSEISKVVMEAHPCDIFFVVSPNINYISFRTKRDDLNLEKVSKLFLDDPKGYGRVWGGSLTKRALNLLEDFEEF